MKLLSYLFLVTFVTAFSCGKNPEDPPITSPPTTVGKGTSYGQITGFGSIIVNGIKFSTTGANIFINGQTGTESQLKLGMIVDTRGTFDGNGSTGSATSIQYQADLIGPLESANLSTKTYVIMGQNVIYDDATVFDTGTIIPLVVSNMFEVNGHRDQNGNLRATYIRPLYFEFTQGVTEVSVRGTVSNFDPVNKTLRINSLTVNYSSLDLGPFSLIWDGSIVLVKGKNLTASVLTATSINQVDLVYFGQAGESLEIDGFVTSFTSKSDFSFGKQRVITDSQTIFENGTSSDIALGAKLEVEGTLQNSFKSFLQDPKIYTLTIIPPPNLLAKKISFKKTSNIKIKSAVATIDLSNNTLGFFHEAFSPHLTVKTNSLTRFEDKSSTALRPFALVNISTSNYLKVQGYKASDGTLVATIVERENPKTENILQGPIESIGTDFFRILGTMILTNSSTTYKDVNDNTISKTDFYNTITVGTIVKAKVVLEDCPAGCIYNATKAEIE